MDFVCPSNDIAKRRELQCLVRVDPILAMVPTHAPKEGQANSAHVGPSSPYAQEQFIGLFTFYSRVAESKLEPHHFVELELPLFGRSAMIRLNMHVLCTVFTKFPVEISSYNNNHKIPLK
jgi:hypothetical protein